MSDVMIPKVKIGFQSGLPRSVKSENGSKGLLIKPSDESPKEIVEISRPVVGEKVLKDNGQVGERKNREQASSPEAPVSSFSNAPILQLDESAQNLKVKQALPIDRQVPMLMKPVAEALGRHWDFLYSRVDPARSTPDPNKKWCDAQRDTTAQGVERGLEQLKARGHKKGTGKVAVLGGGYEVDMKPLLEQFAEVHVVDLSDKPFPVVDRQNADDPNKHKLKYIQTDLSGMPAMYQAQEVERLSRDRKAGKSFDAEGVKEFVGNMPPLEESSLETDGYAMVVTPVLTESMPYGPALTDIEARRDAETEAAGIDDSDDRRSTWKHVSSYLDDGFYFDSRVRTGFDRLFQHQSNEIERLLKPGGVGVVSFWTRPDERQETEAPTESNLRRVGDNTMKEETFQGFFEKFHHEEVTATKIYGPDKKPTVHCYTIAKP